MPEGHDQAAQVEQRGAVELRCLAKTTTTTTATTRKAAPAMSDSLPLATRGARTVVSRPTARSRTDGSMTRAMKRKTIGSALVDVGLQLCGQVGQDVVDDVVLGQPDDDGGDERHRDVLEAADHGGGVAVDHQQGHGDRC